MKQKKTVIQYHDRERLNDLEAILDGAKECNHNGYERFTATFGDGIEMDVNVVFVPDDEEGRGSSYVEAILYINSHELSSGDISESLVGIEFTYGYDDTEYTFIILKEK